MKFLSLFLLLFTTTTWASDLKVLSWNVFMLPKPIKISWQNYRTKLISEQLSSSDYDVMFFMEAFTGSFQQAMKKKLKSKYPYSHYLKKKNLVYPIMGSGVFVMSKHPFKILDHDYYQNCGKADCHASKGVLLIEMQLPNGKTAQFASTHLQSGKKHGATRMQQMLQIQAVLEKHARPGIAQFLLGDLNIDRYHPEFNQGLNLLGMEHMELEGPITYTNHLKNECYKTSGDGINHKWLDHIWSKNADITKSHFNVKVMDFPYNGVRCPLSDHHAVEASITL